MKRRKRYQPRETPQVKMERMLRVKAEYLQRIRLPGAVQYVENHPDVEGWIDQQKERADSAFREGHEPGFHRGLVAYVEGWERVNELLAAEYALRVTDPKEWDLYYVRWMKNVRYIVFDSEKWGEFTMYREPPHRPIEERWFTVDEAIDMLENPLFSVVLDTFDAFPSREEMLPRLERGAKVMHLDVTNEGASWRAEFVK